MESTIFGGFLYTESIVFWVEVPLFSPNPKSLPEASKPQKYPESCGLGLEVLGSKGSLNPLP